MKFEVEFVFILFCHFLRKKTNFVIYFSGQHSLLKWGQLLKERIFSSPGRSPGRAIILPQASALALASVAASAFSKKFNVEVFYVMGKALSGELSCPCDRSCFSFKS